MSFEKGIYCVLFADVCESSKIKSDEKKEYLYIHLIKARHIFSKSKGVIYENTWGDGVVVVSSSCVDLANDALEFLEMFTQKNWETTPLKMGASIRVALDLKTLIVDKEGRAINNFLGRGADEAARLEPVVSPNHVFCSETFLNLLNAEEPENIGYENVGQFSLKSGGISPTLFSLHRLEKEAAASLNTTRIKRELIFDNTPKIFPVTRSKGDAVDLKQTVHHWKNLSFKEFSRVYDCHEYQTLLKYIERRMKSDLIKMLATSGLDFDAFFSARIKTAQSIYRNISDVKAGSGKYTGIKKGQKYFLHEIFGDIVGMRVICVDTPTLFVFIKSLLVTGNIKVAEDCDFYMIVNNEKGSSLGDLIDRFIDGEVKFKTKSSRYQSIHFSLRFDSKMDEYGSSLYRYGPVYNERIKQIGVLRQQLSDQMVENIRLFPIELQARLFTTHIWARDEHRVKYKSFFGEQKHLSGPNAEIDDMFKKLDGQLREIEATRKEIRLKVRERNEKDMRFIGKSFEAKTRLAFFDVGTKFDVERKTLKIADQELVRIGRGNGDEVKAFLNVEAVRASALKTHEEDYFLHPSGDNIVEQWGRQRVVFLVLGYILLFSDNASSHKVIERLTEFNGLKEIFGGCLNKALWDLVCSRCYEFVAEMDRAILGDIGVGDNEKAFVFEDPLVYSRLATSYYKREEFESATKAIEKMFHEPWFCNFDWRSPPIDVPKLFQFYLRRAEYLWYSAEMIDENLVNQGREILCSLDMAMNDSGKENLKVISWVVLISKIMMSFKPYKIEASRLFKIANEQFLNMQYSSDSPRKSYFQMAKSISLLASGDNQKAENSLKCAETILQTGTKHHPKKAVDVKLMMVNWVRVNLV